MSEQEFKVKKIKCDISDISKISSDMEGKWLQALLLRLGVPNLMLKRKLNNRMGNQQWREYLFDSFYIDIFKDKYNEHVSVIKYVEEDKDGKTETIAEWLKPETIRINKKGQRPYCELRLKYWQLV